MKKFLTGLFVLFPFILFAASPSFQETTNIVRSITTPLDPAAAVVVNAMAIKPSSDTVRDLNNYFLGMRAGDTNIGAAPQLSAWVETVLLRTPFATTGNVLSLAANNYSISNLAFSAYGYQPAGNSSIFFKGLPLDGRTNFTLIIHFRKQGGADVFSPPNQCLAGLFNGTTNGIFMACNNYLEPDFLNNGNYTGGFSFLTQLNGYQCVRDNQVHWVAMVASGTNVVTFMDGNSNAINTTVAAMTQYGGSFATNTLSSSVQDLYIGNAPDGTYAETRVEISTVELFRQSLTAAQIVNQERNERNLELSTRNISGIGDSTLCETVFDTTGNLTIFTNSAFCQMRGYLGQDNARYYVYGSPGSLTSGWVPGQTLSPLASNLIYFAQPYGKVTQSYNFVKLGVNDITFNQGTAGYMFYISNLFTQFKVAHFYTIADTIHAASTNSFLVPWGSSVLTNLMRKTNNAFLRSHPELCDFVSDEDIMFTQDLMNNTNLATGLSMDGVHGSILQTQPLGLQWANIIDRRPLRFTATYTTNGFVDHITANPLEPATNTIGITAGSSLTNDTYYLYSFSLSGGTGLSIKDGSGTQFATPVLNMGLPLKPNWSVTGTAITGLGIIQIP